ncbi:MAG: aspartate 1-decarboxylase [Calditrichaeota bacterium]|nr:aspartate 1-decarboxylase [Calditrichota bacterium]
MKRILMHSKIHRASVTGADLHYEGSCSIDEDILDQANISVYEQLHIVNINNGHRFVTYAIPGKRGSREICLNGACARLAQIGDKIIIMTYAEMETADIKAHKPTVLIMNEDNSVQS